MGHLLWHLVLQSWWQMGHLTHPIDVRATTETHALYLMLQYTAPHRLLLGHQNAYLQGVDWHLQTPAHHTPDWQRLTGHTPAIVGFDFGNFKDTDNLPFARFLPQVKSAHRDGAVITFSWHMYHPLTGQKPGPPEADPRDAMATLLPGQTKHAWYRRQLDRIAAFAKAAKDDQKRPIPILFRPFHEHNGDWFWWSRTTQRTYIALWRWTVRYLRDVRQIHQLLYVFSPSDQYHKSGAKSYLRWYPGDEYVDIMGLDCYADHIQQCLPRIREMVVLARRAGKPAALTETGQPTSKQLKQHKYPWTRRLLMPLQQDPIARHLAYAMLWRNATRQHRYLPTPAYGIVPPSRSARDFLQMLHSPFVANARIFRRQTIPWLLAALATRWPPLSLDIASCPPQWQAPAAILRDRQNRLFSLRYHRHQITWDAIAAPPASHPPSMLQEEWQHQSRGVYLTPQHQLIYLRQKAHRWTPEIIPATRWQHGTSASIASPPRALAWTSAGTEHIYFRDSRHTLHWLSQSANGKGWQATHLHQQLNRLPAAAGRPMGWTQTHDLTAHIVTRSQRSQLLHLWYSLRQKRWHWRSLIHRFPRRTWPASDPFVYTWHADQRQHIIYRGRDQHIYELIRRSSRQTQRHAWTMFDLHTASGSRIAAIGQPIGHSARWHQAQFVFYRGPQQRIHALVFRATDRRWRYLPISQLAGIPQLQAISEIACFDWPTGRSLHLLFQGNDRCLHEIWYERNQWHHTPLCDATQRTKTVGTPATYSPTLPSNL